MAKYATLGSLDITSGKVLSITEVSGDEGIPANSVIAPNEVEVGWVYSSGHWGAPEDKPSEPEIEPPSKIVGKPAGAESEQQQAYKTGTAANKSTAHKG